MEKEYVSILSDAQRAVGTATIERFLQVIGNIVPVFPEVKATPNIDELIRDYADRLNVPGKALNPREVKEQILQQGQELEQTREAALVGGELTNAARNLSETNVGGGQNALQALLGG